MDCNRDEAARSRGIAEKKFMQQDYLGARKFALKARQLFPDLEGLVQFIAVVDVHVTAHEKLQNGETNLYGILQSDPYADEASLRKQYRKLALVLHPDKNKALGAETAFKLVSEAWTILSDNTKKAAYDKLRNPIAPKTGPQKKSQPNSRPAPQSKQAEKPPFQRKQAEKPPPAACKSQTQTPHNASSNAMTFWTACPDCKLQYEYHNMYKNKNLCCPFCLKAFFARELSVLVNGPVIWPPLQEQNRANVDARTAPGNGNGYSNGTKLSTANPISHSHSSQENPEARKENIGAEAAYGCKEQVGKKDMDHFETKSRAQAEAYNPSATKPHAVMEQKLHVKTSEECKVTANAETKEPPKAFTTEGHYAPDEKAGVSVNVPYVDLDVELNVSPLKKAKVDVQGLTKEQFVNENLKTRLSETGFDMKNADHSMPTDFNVKNGQSNIDPMMNQESPPASKPNSSMRDAQMNCDVPDSDFYNFDNDRTEQHFSAGQLWACYDDDDGLPRFYARIVKVISQQPFKIQYTWLEARSASEEVTSWLNSGFSYTCGEFKLGKTFIGDSVCMFSHVMAFEKGQKACFKIFPRKGEVWALYKDWDTLKRKDEKHGYDLVEVLTEYSDEVGVQVCVLVKVEGFKSVFKQQSGVVFEVLPDQMRRFSHNIPGHRLIRGEIPECIEGFLELDLASTPMK